MSKKKKYANKNYKIRKGDIVCGLIISQEEEAIIGIIKEEIATPDKFEEGAVFQSEYIDYTVIETDTFSIDDLKAVKSYEKVICDLVNLSKNNVIVLCNPLSCVSVCSSYF